MSGYPVYRADNCGAQTFHCASWRLHRFADMFGSTAAQRAVWHYHPVISDESIPIAQSYDGVADMLLLDSHRTATQQLAVAAGKPRARDREVGGR